MKEVEKPKHVLVIGTTVYAQSIARALAVEKSIAPIVEVKKQKEQNPEPPKIKKP